MPILLIKAVHSRLDKAVNYAINPKKTCLDEQGRLGGDPHRHGSRWYAATLNCQAPQLAYSDMMNTKSKFGKLDDGRLGYRFIQSFNTGEATPEQAHAVGVEFARRVFGDRYEVVVGTHLDTETIHNHIVVNSISFVDGLKLHTSKKDFLVGMRGVSDQVAREHGLSVIEQPQGKGRHYSEHLAVQKGEPIKRDLLRREIDEAIKLSFTFETFIDILRSRGNRVRYSENRTYISVQPPGSERHFRLTEKSLGAAYTVEGIKRRLALQRDGVADMAALPPPPARYASTTAYKPRQHRKLKGFIALYYHYLYFLKIIKKGGKHHKLPFFVREDVTKAQRYSRQFMYMYRHSITTTEELQAHRQGLVAQIDALVQQRLPLYAERRNTTDEAKTAALSQQINAANAALRQLRRERRLCEDIEVDAQKIAEKAEQAEAVAAQARQAPQRGDAPKEKFRLL